MIVINHTLLYKHVQGRLPMCIVNWVFDFIISDLFLVFTNTSCNIILCIQDVSVLLSVLQSNIYSYTVVISKRWFYSFKSIYNGIGISLLWSFIKSIKTLSFKNLYYKMNELKCSLIILISNQVFISLNNSIQSILNFMDFWNNVLLIHFCGIRYDSVLQPECCL